MIPIFRVALVCSALAAAALRDAAAQTPPLDCRPWGNKPSLGTMCTLAHVDTVKGHTLPGGTRLHYDSAGRLTFVVLMKRAVVARLELAGTGDGPHHQLYVDGTPRVLWLARTQDVQGVPCRPISFWTEIVGRTSAVRFHPNGKLATCRMGRAATILGRRFGKGDQVFLDPSGRLAVGER